MLLEGTASILPPQQTVAEILENVGADADLLDACRALRDRATGWRSMTLRFRKKWKP